MAIYPIIFLLRQDCNKILLHFHYILLGSCRIAVGLKKNDYIFITFILHHCTNRNVIKM